MSDSTKQRKPLSQRSRWNREVVEYSAEVKLKRKTVSVIGKITHDNKSKLIPKIIQLYNDQVDDEHKLMIFLSVIFERAVMERIYNSLFIDILSQLFSQPMTKIDPLLFQQNIRKLCDEHFNKYVIQSNQAKQMDDILVFADLVEMQWQKDRKQSISQLISELVQAKVIEFEILHKYLSMLFQDELKVDEDDIEAIIGLFSGVKHLLQSKKKITPNDVIWIKNPEMKSINVDIKSYQLLYGYLRSKIPTDIIDVCICYYDVHWYIMHCYRKLEEIPNHKDSQKKDSQNEYSVRTRLLILNFLTDCK